MSRFDQAKMLLKVKKLQKELQKEIITVEKTEKGVRLKEVFKWEDVLR